MIGIDVVIGIGLPQPLVLLVVDAGLQPRIAVQMPDAPCVAHGVAGSHHLRMETVVDDGAAVLLGLVRRRRWRNRRRSREDSRNGRNRPPAGDGDEEDRRTTCRDGSAPHPAPCWRRGRCHSRRRS